MATKRTCKFAINQVESFCKNWELMETENLTIEYIKVSITDLDRKWERLNEAFEMYFVQPDKGVEPNYADEVSISYEKACEKAQITKAKLMRLVTSSTTPSVAAPTINESVTVQQSPMTLKLPPCEIENFEGGYRKWPAFRDLFQAVIGKHPNLAPAQKLYHLRSKTRGEANQIVKRFDLVDENFNLAWEALKNRFENPRILAHQQMKQMFGIQFIQTESAKSIRNIQSILNESLSIFESLNITSTWDAILIYLCGNKLPDETMRAWENSLSDHKHWPTWQDMSDYLSKRVEMLETVADIRKPLIKDSNSSKNQTFHSKIEPTKIKFSCKKCKQNHPLRFCKFFRDLSVRERIKYVFSNKYCMNCLSPDHFKSKCVSIGTCTLCNEKHHTMLHIENAHKMKRNVDTQITSKEYSKNINTKASESRQLKPSVNTQILQPSTTSSSQSSTAVNTYFSQNEGATILPTALVKLEHLGEQFVIRVLLDAGSEKTFISSKIQQAFAIPLENHNAQISGLGGTVVGKSKGKCLVNIKSNVSDFKIKLQAIVVQKLSHFLPSRPVKIQNFKELNQLHLADPYFFRPSTIDMIIGSDYLPLINLTGIKPKIANSLEARESHFGWYLSGPVSTREINSFSIMVHTPDTVALQEQLKKFWELEEVEKVDMQSENDKYCEEFYQKTTARQPDGRYIVRLPFKQEFPEDKFLGPSRNMALAQYYRMEKTLEKTPNLKAEYSNVIQEYLHLNHMELVKIREPQAEKHFSFFLPHHAVIRPESKTTKLRVVFNASKKTGSGFSLNDVLHQGPTLQTELTKIMLSWRHYKYVFTGDIQKMYRQILVDKVDRPYQQILFRENNEGPVKTFQLKTVTFGVNCAPFLAIRTLLELSKDCKKENPATSHILENEVYVDDILTGGHTLEEAKSKQLELIKCLNSAKFPLKKVTANDTFLLQHLPREDLLDEEFLKFDASSIVKTLGIRWNAKKDYFYYVSDPIEISSTSTKRKILSSIAKLFDPLGWVGPIIIVAKLLMQELWIEKSDWDELVSNQIFLKWRLFVEKLPEISNIKIPRWTQFTPKSRIQVHGFCDASEKAYCAMLYLRTEFPDGRINSNLLTAKTKVAPLKRTTIPKLELCGALLLTILLKTVIKYDELTYELFLWTDSSIVLGWLQKDPNTLKTFVGNRVSQILSITSTNQWRHVKTEENPADLGSRGCYPQELIQNTLWWNGPTWLQQPLDEWPTPRSFDPTDLEVKKSNYCDTSIDYEKSCNFNLICKSKHTIEDKTKCSDNQLSDVLEEFSSLERALRILSYRLRFIQRIKKASFSSEPHITAEEILFTKTRLIRMCQQIYFPSEYKCLKNKTPLSRKSKLLNLCPFLDDRENMRVGGRLNNSGLRYEERHPIIIPEKSHFARLLVDFTHRIFLHAEHNVMLRTIRQGFYIPRLKHLVRICIRSCKACTIYKRKFQHQIMAALPPERVNFSLPFTYTGVDFAGPFNIKSSPLRNAKILKGYAAVFVCFSTRALHLEICSDLSAEAFLACFSRFTGRRGMPKTLFSDNGRNFLGASNSLLKAHNIFLKTAEKYLINKYSTLGFTWSFIPPYAPHMGGLWEAAVKSMKSHLKKLTTSMSFTFEEFTTVLVKIEAVLNSRPLSPLTENPNEILPLTPGHFLRGAPIIAPPEAPTEIPLQKLSMLKRWQKLKALHTIFAKRWKNEYITELQRRYKWKHERNNLKPDDIVIIKDDLLPPTEWRLGRITNVIRGKDGNVRVADIHTQNGLIRRPIVKLCILPTSENHTKN